MPATRWWLERERSPRRAAALHFLEQGFFPVADGAPMVIGVTFMMVPLPKTKSLALAIAWQAEQNCVGLRGWPLPLIETTPLGSTIA